MVERRPGARRLLARPLARLLAAAIVLFARLITAVRGVWVGTRPDDARRVYFANHTSHADVVLLWAVLPPRLRARTRPVAAADYWLATAARRFVGPEVFRALAVERPDAAASSGREDDRSERGGRDGADGADGAGGAPDPVAAMAAALDHDSLILFPEGTRNESGAPLLPFRDELFRLAAARPGVELVPVWIANLNRVLPKGEFVPIPLVCTVTFGAPLGRVPDEAEASFLARAERALLALAPGGRESGESLDGVAP